jgi:integrase
MSGWTGCDLTAAVGVVVTHRSGHLPRALSAEDLRQLLAVPDGRTTTGSRDFAMLLMLSRLGLRAGEVAGLRLDDFDWRAATVTPRVKGGRRLCLPLPHDVGHAVVSYLRRRPAGVAYRELFLCRPNTRSRGLTCCFGYRSDTVNGWLTLCCSRSPACSCAGPLAWLS